MGGVGSGQPAASPALSPYWVGRLGVGGATPQTMTSDAVNTTTPSAAEEIPYCYLPQECRPGEALHPLVAKWIEFHRNFREKNPETEKPILQEAEDLFGDAFRYDPFMDRVDDNTEGLAKLEQFLGMMGDLPLTNPRWYELIERSNPALDPEDHRLFYQYDMATEDRKGVALAELEARYRELFREYLGAMDGRHDPDKLPIGQRLAAFDQVLQVHPRLDGDVDRVIASWELGVLTDRNNILEVNGFIQGSGRMRHGKDWLWGELQQFARLWKTRSGGGLSPEQERDFQRVGGGLLDEVRRQPVLYLELLSDAGNDWDRRPPSTPDWISTDKIHAAIRYIALRDFVIYFGISKTLIDFWSRKKSLSGISEREFDQIYNRFIPIEQALRSPRPDDDAQAQADLLKLARGMALTYRRTRDQYFARGDGVSQGRLNSLGGTLSWLEQFGRRIGIPHADFRRIYGDVGLLQDPPPGRPLSMADFGNRHSLWVSPEELPEEVKDALRVRGSWERVQMYARSIYAVPGIEVDETTQQTVGGVAGEVVEPETLGIAWIGTHGPDGLPRSADEIASTLTHEVDHLGWPTLYRDNRTLMSSTVNEAQAYAGETPEVALADFIFLYRDELTQLANASREARKGNHRYQELLRLAADAWFQRKTVSGVNIFLDHDPADGWYDVTAAQYRGLDLETYPTNMISDFGPEWDYLGLGEEGRAIFQRMLRGEIVLRVRLDRAPGGNGWQGSDVALVDYGKGEEEIIQDPDQVRGPFEAYLLPEGTENKPSGDRWWNFALSWDQIPQAGRSKLRSMAGNIRRAIRSYEVRAGGEERAQQDVCLAFRQMEELLFYPGFNRSLLHNRLNGPTENYSLLARQLTRRLLADSSDLGLVTGAFWMAQGDLTGQTQIYLGKEQLLQVLQRVGVQLILRELGSPVIPE